MTNQFLILLRDRLDEYEDVPFSTEINISDVETSGDDLTVTATDNNSSLIESIEISNTGSVRTVTVTPVANISGNAVITVTVRDKDNAADTESFNVTFIPVNDTPTPDINEDSVTTNENTAVLIDVLANDDVDLQCEGDEKLRIKEGSIVEDPATVSNGTYEIVPITVNESYVKADGTQGIRQVTRDGIRFTPDPDWTSDESVTFTASYEMYEEGNEDVYTANQKLKITVFPVNDTPFIDLPDSVISVDEDNAAGLGDIHFTVNDEEDADSGLTVSLVSITEDDSNYTPAKPILLSDNISILSATDDDDRILNGVLESNENGLVYIKLRVTDSHGAYSEDTVTVMVNPVQDAPAGGDDVFYTSEDTQKLLDVLVNDDIDTTTQGDTLELTGIVSQPENGSAEISGNKILYTPDQDYFNTGTDTDNFTYSMVDSFGAEATFTVSMHVYAVNDRPLISFNDTDGTVDNQASTNEGTPITLSFTVTDVDNNWDEMNVETSSSNAIVVRSNGISEESHTGSGNEATFTFLVTPYAKYNGVTTLSFTASDPSDAASSTSVVLTVISVNDAPEPVADAINVNEGETSNLYVLANDKDDDLITNPLTEHLSVKSVKFTDPENDKLGTLTLNNDSTAVIFTPSLAYKNWNGTVSFDYEVVDAEGASVWMNNNTLIVKQVNDAPVANPDETSVDEDNSVIIDAISNDTDVDMDSELNADSSETISVYSVDKPLHGLASVNAEGNILYTPDSNFNGSDTITYYITDGEEIVQGSVTVTVNAVAENPTIKNDNVTLAEDVTTIIDVLANDSDIDSDVRINLDDANINDGTLTITSVDGQAIADSESIKVANGTVELTSGILKYTSDKDYVGNDSFIYTAENSDGNYATATVYITVTNVNDTPTAEAEEFDLTEGDASIGIDLKEYTDDVDLDVSANNESLSYSLVSSTDDSKVTLAGGVVTVSPDENFNGDFEFEYKVTDTSGAYAGNQIIVHVAAVADNPTIVADNRTVYEEIPTDIAVLTNDSDIDSDSKINLDLANINDGSLTITAVDGNAIADSESVKVTNGTVELNAGILTYTSDKDYVGDDAFSYTAANSDGNTATATVFISVENRNDAPIADAISSDKSEGNALTVIDLEDYTSDIDQQTQSDETLTYSWNTDTATDSDKVSLNGSIITINPDENFNGDFIVDYTVTDQGGLSANNRITIHVATEPDNPTLGDDYLTVKEDTTTSLKLLGNDSDIDSDSTINLDLTNINDGSLTITAVNGTILAETSSIDTSYGTVTLLEGRLNYSPDQDYVGSDSFTYTAENSDGNCSTATVYITVTNVNDAPTAQAKEFYATEGNAATTVDLKDYTDDIDLEVPANGESLSYSLGSATDGNRVSLDGSIVTISPDENFNGNFVLEYTVTDTSGVSASNQIVVNVTAVEDDPDVTDDQYTVDEDTSNNFAILKNDRDIDSDRLLNLDLENINDGILTITAVETKAISDTNSIETSHGTVKLVEGTLEYTPDQDYVGNDSFTYTVINSDGRTTVATVDVTVENVNDAPTAEQIVFDMTEGDSSIQVDLKAYTDDVDLEVPANNETLTYELLGENDSYIVLRYGTFGVNPSLVNENFNGDLIYDYKVTDASGAYATNQVIVHVAAVENNPTINDDSRTVFEDSTTRFTVLDNDYDIDSDSEFNLDTTNINDGSLTITAVDSKAISDTNSVETSHGTVKLVEGTLEYTPDQDYVGDDSFTYTAENSDGNASTATVSVTILNVNDAPVADPAETNKVEGTAATTIDLRILLMMWIQRSLQTMNQ